MTRLYHTGFEWQSATAGVEFSSGNGVGASISTATKRTGSASLRINNSAQAGWVGHIFKSVGSGKAYVRVYINIASLPSGTNCEIIGIWNATAVTRQAHIRLTSGGVLQLYDNTGTQIGSNSSALSTGTWYRIEIEVEGTNAGTEDLRAKLDGTEFAGTTTATVANFSAVFIGAPSAADTFDIYWDDLAINDTAGSVNNSYPGAGGIVIALPTGAGDNAATTGIYSYINEVPPSDTATSGSTMVELDSNGVLAEYNVTDSSTLGIDSYDTINAIQIMARIREEAAGTSSYNLRIKSASGGTTTVSSSVDGGNATPRTNPSGTTAFGRMLISETDPVTAVAWTPTGTNSIDNMQIGVGNADADSTPDLWCLTLAAMIDYSDGVAPGGRRIFNIS